MPRKIRIRFRRPLDPATTAFQFTLNPVTFTRSGAPPPPPPPPPAGGPTWAVQDAGTLYAATGAGATLATGMQAGWTTQLSPDPAPGQTLAVNSGTLSLVSDSTTPTADIVKPYSIEVMDSPYATIVNATKSITYNYGQSYPFINSAYPAGRWNKVMFDAAHGDRILISPGAVHESINDVLCYWNGMDTCLLSVMKAVNISNMTGRGRWSPFPAAETNFIHATHSGIIIYGPGEMDAAARGDITIEGFTFANWGNTNGSNGVKVRSSFPLTSSWNDYHTSITLRNFKIGKPPFEQSASGLAGSAETWNVEDGHVYDTADGVGSAPGNDHNAYISGRVLNMRGMRMNRTRSAEYPFNQANTADGHILKLTFNTATIEGSVLDCGPEGDNSITVQMKGGGNLIVRGCLLLSGVHSQTATGSIVFEKESNNYGSWTYGLAGHSLLIEKNVFINHRPYVPPNDARAMVFFRPPGDAQEVIAASISSCIIRDNIGMSTVPNTGWVKNPPPVFSGSWATANSTETYDSTEAPFANRVMKTYNRAAGPLVAGAGSITTKRFTWPHGYAERIDTYQGLG